MLQRWVWVSAYSLWPHTISADLTRRYRAPELLFSATMYDPFALDIWALGVIITDCLAPAFSTESESADMSDGSDCDSDSDPLEDKTHSFDGANVPTTRKGLFDDTFGDLGLAGSIFRVLGSPSEENWPVSRYSLLPYHHTESMLK